MSTDFVDRSREKEHGAALDLDPTDEPLTRLLVLGADEAIGHSTMSGDF